MPTSSSEATWEGKLRDGRGRFRGLSGAFEAPYSFETRFGEAKGTNPEELLAAAHAACLSMAISAGLEKAGHPATKVTTTAAATVDRADDGFRITTMKLRVRELVAGIDPAAFRQVVEEAKQGCPISQALKGNVQVELDAALE